MIFGEPAEFAIEAYHEPSGPEFAGFGRMCLHIEGIQIGKIRENHCSLFPAARILRAGLTKMETFWQEDFAGRSDMEIFALLNAALYENHGQTLNEMKADWKRLGQHVFLTSTTEQFDDAKTYILCPPGGFVRVLCEKHKENKFYSLSCRVESFQHATMAFLQWFDEQVRNTAPPFFPINPFNLDEKVPENWKR